MLLSSHNAQKRDQNNLQKIYDCGANAFVTGKNAPKFFCVGSSSGITAFQEELCSILAKMF